MLSKTTEKKKKKKSAPEVRTCCNCGGAEGSTSTAELPACARCGLVVYSQACSE
jgi:hypothetical protein